MSYRTSALENCCAETDPHIKTKKYLTIEGTLITILIFEANLAQKRAQIDRMRPLGRLF